MELSEKGLIKILSLVAQNSPTKVVTRGYTFKARLNKTLNQTIQLYAHHRRAAWNWGVAKLQERYQATLQEKEEYIQLWHTYDCGGAPEDKVQFYLNKMTIQAQGKAEIEQAIREERKAQLPMGYEKPWYDMNEISRLFTLAKKTELPWFEETLSSVHTQALLDLGKAMKAFFEQPNRGFPKFKSRYESEQGFRFQVDSRIAAKSVDLKKGGLGIRLPGFWGSPSGKNLNQNLTKASESVKDKFKQVDWIRLDGGRFPSVLPKMVTVKVNSMKQVEVSFTVEEKITCFEPTGKRIGIDLGLIDFMTNSEGKTENCLALNKEAVKKYAQRLAKAQQQLSRRTKGTAGWDKARLAVSTLQRKIANVRKDFQHKLSNALIKEFGVIAVESLGVKGMMKNRKLSKSIANASWGQFLIMLEAKAKWHNRCVVKVPRDFPSSQLCSGDDCNHQQKMPLNVRIYDCPKCGHHMDRDWNAARNILRKGFEQFEQQFKKEFKKALGMSVSQKKNSV